MRLTSKLYAQHLGWIFKKHWQVQGKRAAGELGELSELIKKGIEVKDSSAVADNKETYTVPYIFKSSANNTSDLQTIGYVFLDSNLISQGLDQALVLTKTIKVDGLPNQMEETIKKTQLSNMNHSNVKQAILESLYFDSQQEKTQIVKIPERPAFVLPRNYGITDYRRNQLIVSRLISECEKIAGKISLDRKIVNNDSSVIAFERDGETIQLNVIVETLISSKRAIEAIKGNYEGSFPDLYPMNPTIAIPRKPISTCRNSFLHRKDCLYSNPHTIVSHCSPSETINFHGTPMTNLQFQARNLLKAFGTATSKARQMYGEMVKELPQPIVVQSIQTDGKTFHFGIFQLNTLELNGIEGSNNYWFNTANIDLYNSCEKRIEKPAIDNYNKLILTTMSVFYNNS